MRLNDYEKSVYSQNGEDGIILKLLEFIIEPNHSFVEIGCASGSENNCRNLFDLGYTGVSIDQKLSHLFAYSLRLSGIVALFPPPVLLCLAVTPNNAEHLAKTLPDKRPDVFSLDIDGLDYFVLRAMLQCTQFRPAIMVLEYNAAFGPRDIVTVPETWSVRDLGTKNLQGPSDHLLYYGCSVSAWRALLVPQGYQFLGVDSGGTNAFFINTRRCFETHFVDVLEFADNRNLVERCGSWTHRYEQIRSRPEWKLQTL